MVPKRSDHYFDLLKFPEESKEVGLKQTMVNQEHVFRKQVQELHRVYKMQMVMMKNSGSKEMCETQYMNFSRDEYCGKSSQQRTLDREFPTGYYPNHGNERFIRKGNGLGTQEKPIDVECYFHDETKSRSRTKELSFSLNVTPVSSPHIINLEDSTENFFKKENEPGFGFVGDHSGGQSGLHFCCNHTNSIHNKGNYGNTKRSLSFFDEITTFRGKSSLNQDYQEKRYEGIPGMKISVGGDISTTSKATMLDLNEPPCDDSLFNLNDRLEIHSPMIISETALDEGLPDLNSEDQECLTSNSQHKDEFEVKLGCRNSNVEEDSVEKADIDMLSPVLSIPSNSLKTMQSTSNLQHKGEFEFKSGCRNSNVAEDSVEKVDIDMFPVSNIPSNSLKTMQSTSDLQHKGEFELKSGCRISNVAKDSVEKVDIDMFRISSIPSNSLKTLQSMSNLQHKDEFELKSGCRNSEGEEDSVEKVDIDMFPVSSIPSNSLKTMQSTSNLQHKDEFELKPGCRNSNGEEDSVAKTDIDMSIVSSNPSNTLTTMQSVTYSENSTPALNSIRSSESSQVDSMGNENDQSALHDGLIRRGAVSLLYFMTENSSNRSIHENQPEHSLDSFESAVLKLQETKLDDFNDVSSNHHEIKHIDEKDSPIKLRRGRRMKDFQKDILPSMASLSRHEICEDVRLMEGVIRSREYKRLRSKDSGDQKWFTPVKSRRSRLNNIGRRCYN